MLLILVLTGCGANAEYYSKPKDPCLKKRGPDVCVKEGGVWSRSHDKEVYEPEI